MCGVDVPLVHFGLAGSSYSSPPHDIGDNEAYYHARFDDFVWTVEVSYR